LVPRRSLLSKKVPHVGATTSVRRLGAATEPFMSISTFYDETTTLSRNVGHASPSNAPPHARRRENSTEPSDFHEIRYNNYLQQVLEQATVAFYLQA